MAASLFQQGIEAFQSGQYQQARALLAQAVLVEPENAEAWLWLSNLVESDEQKWYCLERVLALDPDSHAAAQEFDRLAGRMLAPTARAEPPLSTPVAPVEPAVPGPEPEPTPVAPVEPAVPGPEPVPAPVAPNELPETIPAPTPAAPALPAIAEPAPAASAPPAIEASAPDLGASAPAITAAQEPPSAAAVLDTRPEIGPSRRPQRAALRSVLFGLLGLAAVVLGVFLAVTLVRKTMMAPSLAQAVSPTPFSQTPVALFPTAAPTLLPTEAPSPTPWPTPAVPSHVQVPCPFQFSAKLHVDCYDVTVPEDRAGDPADMLRLSVALVRGQGSTRSPDPLVFLQGEPGAGTLAYFGRLSTDNITWTNSLLEGRDLIVLDQRGAGYSEPDMQCGELWAAYTSAVTEPWSMEQRLDGYREALRKCRDRLADVGVNLASYTTAAGAADVVAVLDALGYRQADLYGASYGTRLAMAVMRDYPERVHSAVLDSPVPLQTNMYLQAEELQESALQALFQGCAADAACRRAYPELEKAYRKATAQFDKTPASVRFPDLPVDGQLRQAAVDGAGLGRAIAWGLRSPDTLGIIPEAIYDARDGDYVPLAYLLSQQSRSYSGLSLGTLISVECSEEILPLSPEQLAADGQGEAGNFFPGVYDAALLYSACQEWGAAPVDERRLGPLVSDIPTLILTGHYDSLTPPKLGFQVVDNLSQGYVAEIPGAGHVPSIASAGECPCRLIHAFLDDPTRWPDDACLASLDPAPFVIPPLPGDVRLEPFAGVGVAGLRPAGWQPGEQDADYLDRDGWLLDSTRVTVQSEVMSVDYWLQQLTAGFAGAGFEEEPQPNGIRELNGLTWNLYTARSLGHPVDVALAQGKKRTILVLMVSEPREHKVMFDRVFIPMVKAVVEK